MYPTVQMSLVLQTSNSQKPGDILPTRVQTVVQLNMQFKTVLYIFSLENSQASTLNPRIGKPLLEQLLNC